MSDAKLFTVAGTSIHKGVRTYRFANSMSRVAVLHANGHTDVNLLPLPYSMTKADAVSYMTKADAVSLITTGAPVFDAAPAMLAASSVDAPVKVAKVARRVAEPKLSDEYDGSMSIETYADLWFARAASRLAAKRIKEMA